MAIITMYCHCFDTYKHHLQLIIRFIFLIYGIEIEIWWGKNNYPHPHQPGQLWKKLWRKHWRAIKC